MLAKWKSGNYGFEYLTLGKTTIASVGWVGSNDYEASLMLLDERKRGFTTAENAKDYVIVTTRQFINRLKDGLSDS